MAQGRLAQRADHIRHTRRLLDEEQRFGEDSDAGRAQRGQIGLHNRGFAASCGGVAFGLGEEIDLEGEEDVVDGVLRSTRRFEAGIDELLVREIFLLQNPIKMQTRMSFSATSMTWLMIFSASCSIAGSRRLSKS